jgi:serine/threonine protein kinase
MPDFGPRWKIANATPIGKGGQGQVYVVSDAQDASGSPYVVKVLSGANLTDDSPRWKRIEEEIVVCSSLNHPNVVRIIDTGRTQKSGFPFFVMPYYALGSLQDRKSFGSPDEIFELFLGICDGMAYVHNNGIVHRDIKPANILLDVDGRPAVGDFGLVFRLDAESLTEMMEVATARWFGAPELRNGHLENPSPSADVYSLGKLLYWLFTRKVYDRDEQDYDVADRKLASILMQAGINSSAGVVDDRLVHAGAFVDDIVSETVRYEPKNRIQRAAQLASVVRQMIARFDAGGHALDLRLAQRCLFCGNGTYVPLATLPTIEKRRAAAGPTMVPGQSSPDIYSQMRDRARQVLGHGDGGGAGSIGPLVLTCDYCGNVQEFRLDIAGKANMNWRP